MLCVGGGPSASAEAVALARELPRVHVIAINNSYLLAPWAELLYFADHQWWLWHNAERAFKDFSGQKCTIRGTGNMVPDPEIFMLHNYATEGLSEQQNGIHTGCNGGYQAVNIATLSGAVRVLLLGYDMHFPGGRSHWHKGHPTKTPESHYSASYARTFGTMLPQLKKLGVSVINCTPGSRITCFPFADLREALVAA